MLRLAGNLCASVGEGSLAQIRKILQLLAVASAVVMATVQPSSWRRNLRTALARNVVSSGVEAIGIIFVLGTALGILLVVQYHFWLGRIVQSHWLGSVWVAIIVRELGPLLVNLVVIARSGSAMAAELALIHVSGEDRVVEGQGLDPLDFFVFPRTMGLVVSVCCLTLAFLAVSFLSVYIGAQWLDTKTGTFWDFTRDTLGALAPEDVASLLFKSTVPALLTGCICCAEGLGAGDTSGDVPRASRIAVQRSVITLFVVSALASIVTYL
jgi:phospholipid/cholesterol/gamma-HCH transport system permease protein